MNNYEFDSAYCNVKFVPENNAVLLTWKQPSYFNNYRTPSLYMLYLLQANPSCNYIVDARHGFEDEKADVEWAFTNLVPLMAQTGCKKVVFIMNPRNTIEGEMDMWGNEFRKYFEVSRAATYEEACSLL